MMLGLSFTSAWRCDDLSVKELVREYISGIGSIHRKLRELLAPSVKVWDERLLSTLRDYQTGTNASLNVGVEAVATSDQGEAMERIQVFTGPIDRRKALERKNRNVGYWTKMLVTSE